jgi:hypothetical protein
VEELAEHDLDDHVLQRDLRLQRVAQQLSGAERKLPKHKFFISIYM